MKVNEMGFRRIATEGSVPLVVVMGIFACATAMPAPPQLGQEGPSVSDDRAKAVSERASSAAKPAESKLLLEKKDVEIWYLDNLIAIEKDAVNCSRAVLAAAMAGVGSDEFFDAQEKKFDRAEAAAAADLDKAKVRLLTELAKNPKGIAAPPIYNVRTKQQHLDEIRKAARAAK